MQGLKRRVIEVVRRGAAYTLLLGTLLTLCSGTARAGDVDVYYWVASTEGSTYRAHVLLTNKTDAPIEAWRLDFTMPSSIRNVMHAAWTPEGNVHHVRGRGWTYAIQPHGSVWFDIEGTFDGAVGRPSGCVLDGAPCTFGKLPDTPGPMPSGSGVDVHFEYTSSWYNGYVASVTLVNRTSAPVRNWALAFDLASTVTSQWNTVLLEREGQRYRFGNASWNAVIPAGGRVTFGFQGTRGSRLPLPEGCSFNGAACTFQGLPEEPATPGPVSIRASFRYTSLWRNNDGGRSFVAQLSVVNTSGDEAIDGWRLRFGLGAEVSLAWNATLAYDGGVFFATPLSWNRRIEPGDSLFFGFQGSFRGAEVPFPEGCVFNEEACTFHVVVPTRAVTTDLEERDELPAAFASLSVAPSPFRDAARLSIEVTATGPVEVDLVDVSGRQVRRLFSGAAVAGQVLAVPVDASGLAAGAYLVRLRDARGRVTARPVIRLR